MKIQFVKWVWVLKKVKLTICLNNGNKMILFILNGWLCVQEILPQRFWTWNPSLMGKKTHCFLQVFSKCLSINMNNPHSCWNPTSFDGHLSCSTWCMIPLYIPLLSESTPTMDNLLVPQCFLWKTDIFICKEISTLWHSFCKPQIRRSLKKVTRMTVRLTPWCLVAFHYIPCHHHNNALSMYFCLPHSI